MKLQRAKTREVRGKAYYKFTLNPPQELLEQLGWKGGEQLEAKAENGALVIRKAETDKSR